MKRKFVFFFLLIVFLLFVTGCEEKKKYGSWDGNYVYINVFRVKTDGTGKETLLSAFSDGKNEYPITENDVTDVSFYGDIALLSVQYTIIEEVTASKETTETSSPRSIALLLYNLKEKTCKYLFSTDSSGEYARSFYIHSFFADYFVVIRNTIDNIKHYTTYDYQGNLLCDDDEIYQNQVIGDHVFRVIDRHLSFCTLKNRSFVTLFPVETDKAYVAHLYGNLYFYDNRIFDPVEEKYCDLPYNANLRHIALDNYIVTAVYNSDNLYEKVNIYKINEDCSYELELDFPDNLYVNNIHTIKSDEKYIRFDCRKRLNDPSVTYTYKKENKTLYKGTASAKGDIKDKWNATDGVQCGKYYYNLLCKNGYFDYHAYSLIRYDSETKESVYLDVKELMFGNHGNYPPNKKFTVKDF